MPSGWARDAAAAAVSMNPCTLSLSLRLCWWCAACSLAEKLKMPWWNPWDIELILLEL
ncbi:putative BEL1-like homeodomain protein 4 [Iris pallida]|uniref:BEL1-like homeodomain protein 4 n=1 Tax=Iris pallida TaxID=29817 RepID=A0AAX6I3Q0_IRIPA|nr:putative BEL1-like homeodomain protein 4 [Iris pallida]